METKKTPQASLENKRVLFLELGLIVSLLAAIGAFSYSTAVRKVPVFQATGQTLIDEEIVPIVRDTPPEPPKAPAIPQFSEILTIVDDNVQTDDVITFDDTDITIPVYDYREYVVDEPVEDEDIPFVLVEAMRMTSAAGFPSTWIIPRSPRRMAYRAA